MASLGYYDVGAGGSLVVTMKRGTAGTSGSIVAGAVMAVNAWSFTNPNADEDDDVADAGTFTTLQQGPLQIPLGIYSTSPGDFNLAATDGTHYDFNYQGQLTQTVDADGNQTQFSYNGNGTLDTIATQGGFTTTFVYTGGYLTSIQDPSNRVTSFQDTTGQLTKVTEPTSTGYGGTPITNFLYAGPDGLLSQVTDADGDVTKLAYDPSNERVDKVTNPDNNYWTLVPFLVDGLATSSSNAQILLAADGQIGNLADSSIPEAQASYVDPNIHTWSYQTDSYGLETAEANPDNVVWQWQCNADGLVTEYSEPPQSAGGDPVVTNYHYGDVADGTLDDDECANLTEQDNPDDSTENWSYGVNNQVTSDTVDNADGTLASVVNYVPIPSAISPRPPTVTTTRPISPTPHCRRPALLAASASFRAVCC